MNIAVNSTPDLSRSSAFKALLFLAPVPTIGVAFAAFGEQGQLGSLIWAFAKVWLFIGPALWWFGVQRQPFSFPVVQKQGLGVGLFSGLLLGVIIFSSYWFIAKPLVDFAPLREMLLGVGITDISHYLGLVVYLTLVNSLIEEYVFRWFMYRQLERFVVPIVAVFCSAVIFTIHHTVVLAAYLPWYFNILASLGVFTGGLLWSYLYYRYKNIWSAYISHIGADIGVFLVGYFILF